MKETNFSHHPGFTKKYLSMGMASLARVFTLPYAFDLFYHLQKLFFPKGYIRAVNYHDIPSQNAANFESQIMFFQKYYTNVSLPDLKNFLQTGVWEKKRPGLIVSFDDGLKSAYDVAAPILQKYKFSGWFLIPTEFVDTPNSEQKKYAMDNLIDYCPNSNEPRIALTWEEIKTLNCHHAIVCHTANHVRLKPGLNREILQKEIYDSKVSLECKLEDEVQCFGWVGGEMESYSKIAARCINDAGYKYAFMTKSGPIHSKTSRYHIHRTFLGPDWPLCIIQMHLSGILDILYYQQRNRINRLTNELQRA